LGYQLFKGRACGSCNVCCVSLSIDEPKLQKAAGHRCRNALGDNSCAIYPTRPATCRTFLCGWRQLRWVKDTLRPDVSDVLVRLHDEGAGAGEARRTGIIVTLLREGALEAEGLAETVAAAVAAGIPVDLELPGPPGSSTSMRARINAFLHEAVMTRDKPSVLSTLRRLWNKGRSCLSLAAGSMPAYGFIDRMLDLACTLG
jgi:hypothetical protein